MEISRISLASFVILSLIVLGCVSSTKEEIVCNEPYIRFGSSCCLDINNNKICDVDEELSEPKPSILNCTDSGKDYCTESIRFYNAVCDNGTWRYSNQTCEHGCQDGICNPTPTCEDGTRISECSNTSIGKLCAQTQELIWNCTTCGCPPNLICYDEQCLSEENQTSQIIQELQDHVVYVEQFLATGSGVILEHRDNQTIIITNWHVIEGAPYGQVDVMTNEKMNLSVDTILKAPEKMDLAILKVNGTHGTPALVSSNYSQGQKVLALGSPLGLVGSVSEGIVSNTKTWETSTDYEYLTVQTDAAVNHGNSGGGLFLKSNGELIGINTFGLTGTQGINFAIDLSHFLVLYPIDTWSEYNAPQERCRDWTEVGKCSVMKNGLECMEGGDLSPNCVRCGCWEDYYCVEEGMYKDLCKECPNSLYSVYVKENGYSFCCPPGTEGAEDGNCHDISGG